MPKNILNANLRDILRSAQLRNYNVQIKKYEIHYISVWHEHQLL